MKSINFHIAFMLFTLSMSAQAYVYNVDNTTLFDSTESEENIKRSYFGIISLGVMSGPMIEGSAKSIFSAKTIHGLQENQYISVGVGLGVEHYPNITLTPLFFDLRTYLLSGDIKPLLFIDIGYSSITDNKSSIQSGGMMLHLGTGFKVAIDNSLSIVVDLGYKNQKVEAVYGSRISTFTNDFFAAYLGISF